MPAMTTIDTAGFERAGVAAQPGGQRPRHALWLAAAATAQSSAAKVIADPHAAVQWTVAPILDSWTALALATRPHAQVPSDTVLVAHVEALLARQGASVGERARTCIELSTLLAARHGGETRPLPLGRETLAAHITRLGLLLAAPPRADPARRRVANLAPVLLGVVVLMLWLAVNPLADEYTAVRVDPSEDTR